jgi:hypothetical protein
VSAAASAFLLKRKKNKIKTLNQKNCALNLVVRPLLIFLKLPTARADDDLVFIKLIDSEKC